MERRVVKRPGRAVEKAVTCYGGDVSRLLDICRARIVFDQLDALAAAAEAIARDPSVQVVRVKNGMHPDHDSRMAGGFRAFLINLCINTEETRILGVENHVCEIQLILHPFAAIFQGDDDIHEERRHEQYLRFRAVRRFYLSRRRPPGPAADGRVHPACDDADAAVVVSAAAAAPAAEGEEGGDASQVSTARQEDAAPAAACGPTAAVAKLAPCAEAPAAAAGGADSTAYGGGGGDDEGGAAAAAAALATTAMDGGLADGAADGDADGGGGNDGGSNGGAGGGGGTEDFGGAAQSEIFLHVFLRSTLRAGGFVDRQWSGVREAFIDSSAGSAWFSSKPLAAATTKRVFQAVLLILALYFGYLCVSSTSAIQGIGLFPARVACLDVAGVRDPGRPAASAAVAAFGLLRDGCAVAQNESGAAEAEAAAAAGGQGNGTFCVAFDGVVTANGYFFVTGPDAPQRDPVRWTVRASTDAGGRGPWRVVGASTVRLSVGGARPFPQLAFATPDARDAQLDFDLRPAWPWLLDWPVTYGINVLSFLCCFAAAVNGRNHVVKDIWLAFSLLVAMAFGLAAVGYHAGRQAREALACWLEVAPVLVFVCSLAFFEAKIIAALLVSSLAFALSLLAVGVLVYDAGLAAALVSVVQSTSSFALVFAVVVTVLRRRALRRARRLVVPDKALYDALWAGVAGREGAAAVLLEMRREVEALSAGRRSGPPAQLNRKFRETEGVAIQITRSSSSQLAHAILHWRDHLALSFADGPAVRRARGHREDMLFTDRWIPGTVDPARPLDSLDQLFVQASCLHPVLLRKVREWALASDGWFPWTGLNGYVKYADVRHVPDAPIRWAKVKSVTRAIEKVFRVYGQDVSKLVDVCRQSIVFDDVGGVLACLKAMGRDEEVQIVRIKNRMDPDFDSARSAGYRDVAINLRVVTPQTLDLGVETHVCEVQLLLRPVAELKNDEFHKRYVEFRNLRGE